MPPKSVLPHFRTLTWVSLILFYNYFKTNRIMITGPKVFPHWHFKHCPISADESNSTQSRFKMLSSNKSKCWHFWHHPVKSPQCTPALDSMWSFSNEVLIYLDSFLCCWRICPYDLTPIRFSTGWEHPFLCIFILIQTCGKGEVQWGFLGLH